MGSLLFMIECNIFTVLLVIGVFCFEWNYESE